MANPASSGRNPCANRGWTVSRRQFVAGATALAAAWTIIPRHVLGGPGQVAPSEKTTLAGIGVGGQGVQNISNFLECPEIQVAAVCDVNRESGRYLSANWLHGKEQRTCGREPARRMVDEYYAAQKGKGKFQACKGYNDYRELLDKEDVDAVMIATPDHTHAVITMAALKKRKHVYCEKPLTWSVKEARLITEAAREAKVATQLGNQGQASEEARLIQEFIADGAIGPVHEVYTCFGARFWPYPAYEGRPKETPPVPDGLDWDLWLGPAPERPYHPDYCPWIWRNWLDFGTGLMGDMGCHWLSTPFKALKLGYPIAVEGSSTKPSSELYPLGEIIRFEFPERDGMPPVTINWFDGGIRPPRIKGLEPGRQMGGVSYVGEKGAILGHRLVPETEMRKYGRPPKLLPRSPGHQKEFVDACRGGPPAGSDFVQHAGLLSEVCMLGNIAVRTQKRLEWDGPNMKITNDEAANQLLHRKYRDGWSL